MAKIRFKKGGKVEVFSRKEVPTGSWHCAEILSGNGHNYTVKYDASIGSCGGLLLDRVSRKRIRPCPPVAEESSSWVSGGVVEVFHCFAWKTATVLQVFSGRQYLVRLLGSLNEVVVGGHDIRERVCWQGDKWVTIPNGLKSSEELKHDEQSNWKYDLNSGVINARASQHLDEKLVAPGNFNYTQDSQPVKSRRQKRSPPFCHSATESYARPCQKIRVKEKNCMRLQFVFAQQSPLPEKVGAVASSQKRVSVNHINSSFNHGITGCREIILEREKTDGVVGCSSDSVIVSSVGSCDVLRNDSHEFPMVFSRDSFEDSESHSSDAESCYRLGSAEWNHFLPVQEKLREEIHRLELNAYSRVLKALHAAGPLSWEQETLLTNLRFSLRISSDEHLMELRNLISNSSCIPSSRPD